MKTYQKLFGEHVKKLRKAQGYSQESFAAHAGLSQAYLSSVERGVANPRIDTVGKIADGLGVDISVLFLFNRLDPPASVKRERFIALFESMAEERLEEMYAALSTIVLKK